METGKLGLIALVFFLGLLAGILVAYYSCSVSTEYPVEIGPDQIIPVTDQDYFPYVHKLLSEAGNSVHMVMFDVKYYPDHNNSKENILLEDLISLAGRGVEVRIVTDQYLTEKPVLTHLRENGVEIKYDQEGRTTHSKLIIVDGRYVLVGSTNWGYYSIERNHEANVLIYSERLARQFGRYFSSLWSEG